MKNFKKWLIAKRPANRYLNFMEVKELSERMEMAEAQARSAVLIYERLKRDYETACEHYMEQCKSNSIWNRHAQ